MTAPLQVRARGQLVLHCTACDKPARIWPYGTHATVAGLILAEQQHRDRHHPHELNPNTLRDGQHENGLG